MGLRVETHYSGSRCVIWRTQEHYIDVQANRSLSGKQDIAECVRNGHVYKRVGLSPDPAIAAEEVIQLMRKELLR